MKKPPILPNLPGVYLFKDKDGTVIYIGKAKSLKDRVASYFLAKRDWKVSLLMEDAVDLDHIVVSSETEALLLETTLIQKHQPRYNVLLKTGQPFLYILFPAQPGSQIELVRNKKRKGTYFGPFLHKTQARRMYDYLLSTFKLRVCGKKIDNGCLEYHLGICPGSCMPHFDAREYQFRTQLAQDALRGNHAQFIASIQDKISEYSKSLEFEKAKRLNEYLKNFDVIFETIKANFTPHKFEKEIYAATQKNPFSEYTPENIAELLQSFFQTPHPINSIDCFDVSHFQSKHIVGSCVRFTNAKPDKNKFRRFKIMSLTEQNDYAALQEIIMRRYKNAEYPDLVLIDGGKGQLSAALTVIPDACVASLAKREEIVFSPLFKEGKKLDIHTPVGKLLIALRDYTHHFAISYHRLRRAKASDE